MKIVLNPVIIIAIAIGCSVAIFFGLSIFDIDEQIEKVVEKQVGEINYDCAMNYDKYVAKVLEKKDYSNFDACIDSGDKEMFELMDHRCFITIESWAYQSSYEQLIWNEFAWEDFSWINQLLLDEIECQDESCEKTKMGMLQIKEMCDKEIRK